MRTDSVPVVVGPAGLSAINTDLITGVVSGYDNLLDYSAACVQIIASAGISAGAVIFEISNDGVNFVACIVEEVGQLAANPVAGAITIAANTRRIFKFHTPALYARCRISTAFVGGTVQAIAAFQEDPMGPIGINVQQSLASSLQVTNTPLNPTSTFVNSAATTNGALVVGTAANLLSVTATNVGAAVRYLKLYNKATAPTVGTDIPVLVIPIPAGGMVALGGGAAALARFTLGLGYAITAGAADTDTAAVIASEVKVVLTRA